MNTWGDSLAAYAEVWQEYIPAAAWQAALIGLSVLVLVRVLRRVPAPIRYALLLLALAKFLVPPTASLPTGLMSQFRAPSGHDTDESNAEFVESSGTSLYVRFDSVNREHSDAETGSFPEDLLLGNSSSEDSLPAASLSADPGVRNRLTAAGLGPRQDRGTSESLIGGRRRDVAAPASDAGTAGDSISIPLTGWLVLIHLCGALGVAAITICQAWRLARIIKACSPVPSDVGRLVVGADVRRVPRLLVSEESVYPFSCGVLNPTVVIPARLITLLSRHQLEAVLRHEWTHHRRGDLFVNWLQILVTVVWWFHPVLWLVNRSLRLVREECCDDRLLARREVCDEVYCETLLEVARSAGRRDRTPTPLTVSMADGQHPLAARLERIMDSRLRRSDRLGAGGIAIAMVLALVLLPGLYSAEPAALPAAGAESESPQPAAATPVVQESVPVGAFHGIVRDSNRAAVADAVVFVVREEGWGQPDVLEHTKTDARGRFEFNLAEQTSTVTPMTTFAVLVKRNGYNIAWIPTRGQYPQSLVEVTLADEQQVKYQILGPDRKPIPGARVSPVYVNLSGQRSVTLPDTKLADALGATTDAEGRAVLRGVAAKDITSLAVTSERFGKQQFSRWGGDGVPSELVLRTTGRVVGQVDVPSGIDPTQIRFNLGTYAVRRQREGELRCSGVTEVSPDASGRFVIPAIATGQLRGVARVPAGFAAVEEMPQDLMVAAESDLQMVIPFRRGVRVRRRLTERDTGQPIVGARVILQGKGLSRTVVTDQDGQFSAWLHPKTEYHTAYDIPNGYLQQNRNDRQTQVGGGDTDLPDIEYLRASEISGRVVDSAGQPQANVRLLANWNDPEEDFGDSPVDGIDSRTSATTDFAGRFRLQNVHPGVDVSITPLRNGILLAEPVIAAKGVKQQDIEIAALEMVSLSGRIIGWTSLQDRNPRVVVYANFAGRKASRGRVYVSQLTMESDGSFVTEPHFADKYAYQVRVFVNHSDVGGSGWLVPNADRTTTFAPISVPTDKMQHESVVKQRPRFEMTRTVVDSSGAPVAEADVIAWYLGSRRRLKTDAGGKLTLSGVPNSGAWIFIRASGFRFFGRFEPRQVRDQKLRLVRREEPDPQPPLRTRKTDPVSAALLTLAKQKLTAAVDHMLDRPDIQQYRREQAHRLLARYHPDGAAELQDKGSLSTDAIEWHRILNLADTDFEAALNRISQQEKSRQMRLLQALFAVTGRDSETRRRLIRESASKISVDVENVEALAGWGGLLLDLGDRERAESLFARALKHVSRIPRDDRAGFTRSYLAWNYAPLDHAKALELISDETDARTLVRCRTNIALRLADKNPEVSREMLKGIPAGRGRDEAALKAVGPMATVEPNGARAIAYRISDPRVRAHAFAMVADADPQAKDAVSLIRKAYSILEKETNAGDRTGRSVRSSLTTAVAILPMVERVVPEEMREYFLRALSLRRGIAVGSETRALGPYGEGRTLRLADPVLACALSRYDRVAARHLALDPADETLDLAAEHAPFQIFAAMAILDPETVVRTVDALPATTARQIRSKVSAWSQVVLMLSSTVEQRWNHVMERHYYLPDPRQPD